MEALEERWLNKVLVFVRRKYGAVRTMCMCRLGFALGYSSQTLKLRSKEVGAEERGGVDAVDAVGWVTSVGARRAVPPGALEVHDGKAKCAASF